MVGDGARSAQVQRTHDCIINNYERIHHQTPAFIESGPECSLRQFASAIRFGAVINAGSTWTAAQNLLVSSSDGGKWQALAVVSFRRCRVSCLDVMAPLFDHRLMFALSPSLFECAWTGLGALGRGKGRRFALSCGQRRHRGAKQATKRDYNTPHERPGTQL